MIDPSFPDHFRSHCKPRGLSARRKRQVRTTGLTETPAEITIMEMRNQRYDRGETLSLPSDTYADAFAHLATGRGRLLGPITEPVSRNPRKPATRRKPERGQAPKKHEPLQRAILERGGPGCKTRFRPGLGACARRRSRRLVRPFGAVRPKSPKHGSHADLSPFCSSYAVSPSEDRTTRFVLHSPGRTGQEPKQSSRVHEVASLTACRC